MRQGTGYTRDGRAEASTRPSERAQRGIPQETPTPSWLEVKGGRQCYPESEVPQWKLASQWASPTESGATARDKVATGGDDQIVCVCN